MSVPDERIDSVVRNAVVTLKGNVDHWYERQAAADTVRNLLGVVSVDNQIIVAPPARADAAIRDELKSALVRRFPLEIDAVVDRGIATLTGKVLSYRARRDAEQIAWSTPGVKTVTNNIEVTF